MCESSSLNSARRSRRHEAFSFFAHMLLLQCGAALVPVAEAATKAVLTQKDAHGTDARTLWGASVTSQAVAPLVDVFTGSFTVASARIRPSRPDEALQHPSGAHGHCCAPAPMSPSSAAAENASAAECGARGRRAGRTYPRNRG